MLLISSLGDILPIAIGRFQASFCSSLNLGVGTSTIWYRNVCCWGP